jgi:hypothetical protein
MSDTDAPGAESAPEAGAETTDIRAAIVHGMDLVLSTDAKNFLLRFDTSAGKVDLAARTTNVGALIGEFIKIAAEAGSRLPSQVGPAPQVHPIQVGRIEILPGRVGSEIILALQSGPLTLTFAIELEDFADAWNKAGNLASSPHRTQ